MPRPANGIMPVDVCGVTPESAALECGVTPWSAAFVTLYGPIECGDAIECGVTP